MSLFGPGTSPRLKGFPNRKPPALFPFSSALVSPEWGWFWRDVIMACPIWEGAGTETKNLAPDRSTDGTPSTPTSTLLPLPEGTNHWVPTQRGHALSIQVAGNELRFWGPGGANEPIDLSGWDEFSMFIALEVTSYSGGNAGFFRTRTPISNGNTFFITNANAGLWIRWNGTDTVKNSFTLDVGQTSFGCSVKTGDQRVYMAGKLRGSDTTAITFPTGADADIYRVGWQATTAERVDGYYQALYLFRRFLSNIEHAQLGRDPFGPFRTRSLPLFIPSVEVPDTFDVAQMLSPTPRWDNKVRFY